MIIYVYGKSTENVKSFSSVIQSIKSEDSEVFVTIENRRCFRELENIKRNIKHGDIVIVKATSSLGLNDTDVYEQLNWFIVNSMLMVICDFPATYEYGVTQPMNKAVLDAVVQSLAKEKNIVPLSKRSNSGRSRLAFPDEWDELYDLWEKKEISSKEFLTRSGLKKATFYNMITEYKILKDVNNGFISELKKA